jgi:predicted regulator of Ras-like GTPase activity (Roadblock/LC7/MglB family)
VYDILNKLNKVDGVRGSLVIGRDGLVIAADLGTDVNEAAVAAVGSQILNSLQGALRRMQMGTFKRFVVTGRDGKIVIADAAVALLVVILELEANMGLAGVEIKEAMQEVQKKVKMT